MIEKKKFWQNGKKIKEVKNACKIKMFELRKS